MEDTQYAVEMLDICKYFGPVQANNHINIRVKKGEIHAIVGENGAGKTTLMNILYGLLEPSSGKILIEGRPVRITSARKAISLGIGMVHQHFKLVPNFTVAENICLGHEPLNRLFCVDQKKMTRHAKEISDRYGLMIDPAKRVCDLSVGLLQRVEILKAPQPRSTDIDTGRAHGRTHTFGMQGAFCRTAQHGERWQDGDRHHP